MRVIEADAVAQGWESPGLFCPVVVPDRPSLEPEREVQLGYARALFDLELALADLEREAGVELNDGPAPD